MAIRAAASVIEVHAADNASGWLQADGFATPGRARGRTRPPRETMTQPLVEPAGRRFRAFTAKHLDALVQRAGLSAPERLAIKAVGMVLPFRTNSYVVDTLIDWDAAPDDPIFRLVFPQEAMLPVADVNRIAGLLSN